MLKKQSHANNPSSVLPAPIEEPDYPLAPFSKAPLLHLKCQKIRLMGRLGFKKKPEYPISIVLPAPVEEPPLPIFVDKHKEADKNRMNIKTFIQNTFSKILSKGA